jgi:hypothetical protein
MFSGWIFTDFHAFGIGFHLFSYFWDGFSLIFILLGWISTGFHTSGMDLIDFHASAMDFQ